MGDLTQILPILVSFITAVGGLAVGLVALRKAGAESRKTNADASGVLVDSAGDVVKLLRDQMAAQQAQLEAQQRQIIENSGAIRSLEETVGSWENWVERVLQLLDRAVGMLEEEQKQRLIHDVAEVKDTRPMRSHRKRTPPQPA